ncbi:hypothetical protein K492DRAFT_198881 [Lichtheimia hyalospora FSU 10163]|nr:hypothetical protein K492DRAFT_198881 [Lichtheimia hyalospora FSU 10163]
MTLITPPSWPLLDSRRSKFTSVLYLCVLSLGSANNFYDAHQMATVLYMLDIPFMFYCHGVLYAMQGFERAAFSAFHHGLESCSSNSVDYRLINEALSNIQKQRVDFVSVIPNELIYNIFLMVQQEDPLQLVQCMQVSKHWCGCISQYRGLWQRIKIQGRVHVDEQTRLLPLIASHPTNIVISRLSKQDVAMFTHWMLQSNLKRLSRLDIHGCAINSQFITLLQHIRHTLTELSVDIPESSNVSVTDILTLCPQLKYLDYQDFYKPLNDTFPFKPIKPLDLKSLRLLCWGGMTSSVIQHILQCSPALRQLAIHGCCSIEVLNIVTRASPQMQHLWVNHAALDTSILRQQYMESAVKETLGVRTLLLGYSDELQPHHVLPLLETSNNTLQKLSLLVPHDVRSIQQWQALAYVSPRQLTRLTCQFNIHLQSTFAALIRTNPLLESIHFQMSDLSSDEILDAILQLDGIRELSIHSPLGLNSVGLARIFSKQIHLGKHSTLSHVHMRNIQAEGLDLPIIALGLMKDLETITLAQCTGATTDGFHLFFERLVMHNGKPMLRRLNVEKIQHISNEMIQLLQQGPFSHQCMIHLVGLPNVSYQAVEELVAAHPPYSLYASACSNDHLHPPIRYCAYNNNNRNVIGLSR